MHRLYDLRSLVEAEWVVRGVRGVRGSVLSLCLLAGYTQRVIPVAQ